jgi:adenine specific DNA methylase Mod
MTMIKSVIFHRDNFLSHYYFGQQSKNKRFVYCNDDYITVI